MRNLAMDDPAYWEGVREPLDGVRSREFTMGSLPRSAARVLVLEMEPGFVIARHAHNADRFEMIVKGSLHIGEKVYYPGAVMTACAHEYYGPKVCGPEGCTTVEFFAGEVQGESLLFELADGSRVTFDPEAGMPDNLAEADWISETRAAVLAQAR